jgi:predicted adenylyl cyclase CyaB
MKRLNFEFKARLNNEQQVRAALKQLEARFVGTDHQIDTYFRVPSGRLKVREGRLENALIFYQRKNLRRARQSTVEVMLLPRRNPLRAILARSLGTLAVVDKRREIYFVKNVKIHLDRARQLGKFVEVEAISRTTDVEKIRSQARQFQELFGITAKDIIAESYSDLILAKSAGRVWFDSCQHRTGNQKDEQAEGEADRPLEGHRAE